MLNYIFLQAGTIRKIATYEAAKHRNELGELLSSWWFWLIVAFIGICVLIYNVKNDNEKK